MSSISGVSSSSSTWAAQRAQHQARMFAKVDADGSGSVDQSELDAMLSDISEKTGASFGDTKQLFSKLDTNGDGKISESELAAGKPQGGPDGAGGPQGAGGPPPMAMGGAGGAGGTDSASSSSSSTTYDPLDTNQDGVVSEMERLAGALKELASASNNDDGSGTSSANSEIAKLAQKLYEQIENINKNLSSSNNSTTITSTLVSTTA